jgi:hypothetical protein
MLWDGGRGSGLWPVLWDAGEGGGYRCRSRVLRVTNGGDEAGAGATVFLSRLSTAASCPLTLSASAVIDKSGTWRTPNPVGGYGYDAVARRASERIQS